MNPKVAESWEELTDFIVFRNSLDLGALGRLNDSFLTESNQDVSSFPDQITTFLAAVNSQAKTRPHNSADLLAVLSIDSLISNLYSHTKNGEQFQPNSSSFYGWMSSSQMSMDHSSISQRQAQLIPEMIAALANSQPFFKRLKASMQKSRTQQKSKRCVEGLLDTLDSVLGIEKITRQNFNKLRGKHIGLERGKKFQMDFPAINQILFSSQLNKVVAVLTQGHDHVHLALLRIYLNWNEELRMYEGAKFNGDEMLVNLYRYYVSCFRDVEDVFEEGKHPLFRLVRNHLALFFTPTLRKFHQVVVKIGTRYGSQSGFSFYKASSNYLEAQLSQFINEMPNELLKLLSQLKDILEEQYPSQPNEVLAAVKKMFFYSFLLNESLIEELYPRHDPSKWEQTYSHILNLFFQSSLKKYGHLPQSQQDFIRHLVQKIAASLDDRIIHQYVRLQTQQLVNFKVRDSILNHDFEVVHSVLSNLEFTPKDSKQFQMKKICPIAPESPVYHHFKTQGFKSEQVQEELQMATWMSIGGNHDYSTHQSKAPRRNLSQRLQDLKTIDAKTRSHLQSESESFLQYFRSF